MLIDAGRKVNTVLSLSGYTCGMTWLLQEHAIVNTTTTSVDLYLLYHMHCHVLAAQGCQSSLELSNLSDAEWQQKDEQTHRSRHSGG